MIASTSLKNLNDAVDEVRRTAVSKAKNEEQKIIKGSRYLLLAKALNLNQKGLKKLADLVELNEDISVAYQLKE